MNFSVEFVQGLSVDLLIDLSCGCYIFSA